MSFKKVSKISEIDQLLDRPYNAPVFDERFTEMEFEDEYINAHEQIRKCLEIFGPVTNYGNRGISLGPPARSRKIGIVIDATEYFRPEILVAVEEAVNKLPRDYLVYIDCEDEDENAIYFCIRKNTQTLAFAEEPETLRLFIR
jgi:hypothetical protein